MKPKNTKTSVKISSPAVDEMKGKNTNKTIPVKDVISTSPVSKNTDPQSKTNKNIQKELTTQKNEKQGGYRVPISSYSVVMARQRIQEAYMDETNAIMLGEKLKSIEETIARMEEQDKPIEDRIKKFKFESLKVRALLDLDLEKGVKSEDIPHVFGIPEDEPVCLPVQEFAPIETKNPIVKYPENPTKQEWWALLPYRPLCEQLDGCKVIAVEPELMSDSFFWQKVAGESNNSSLHYNYKVTGLNPNKLYQFGLRFNNPYRFQFIYVGGKDRFVPNRGLASLQKPSSSMEIRTLLFSGQHWMDNGVDFQGIQFTENPIASPPNNLIMLLRHRCYKPILAIYENEENVGEYWQPHCQIISVMSKVEKFYESRRQAFEESNRNKEEEDGILYNV